MIPAYVIEIKKNEKSVEVADRCVKSGERFGQTIYKWPAYTPEDKPLELAKSLGIPVKGFEEKYSRLENCVGAFLSHHSLWLHCVELNQPILILEHDAVMVDALPIFLEFDHLINVGAPSYGKWLKPAQPGVYQLFSKSGGYMPGAHAYIIKPTAARALIKAAKSQAKPTDIFLNKHSFPWIQELYPWCFKAIDSFTTIQNETGCKAKHNFNEEYEIEKV